MLIAKTKEKNVNISLHSLKLMPIADAFGITISKVSFKSLFIVQKAMAKFPQLDSFAVQYLQLI